MRIALTADLHWGHGGRGDAATRALVRELASIAPDTLVLAGDVGTGRHWSECLQLFADLPCRKLVLPGNHDLWTELPSPDSLDLYQHRLPLTTELCGFHYLDGRPYVTPEGTEAILGSINWYDYSFAPPELFEEFSEARRMLHRKLFPMGRHNDGVYVQLGMDDAAFTELVVAQFRRDLESLPETVERILVAQHHPPVEALFYPSPLTQDYQWFWRAYTGNRAMQEAVLADERIRWIVCGHTHYAVSTDWQGRRCHNIGGDYDWKRLVLLDTDSGHETFWEFGR